MAKFQKLTLVVQMIEIPLHDNDQREMDYPDAYIFDTEWKGMSSLSNKTVQALTERNSLRDNSCARAQKFNIRYSH